MKLIFDLGVKNKKEEFFWTLEEFSKTIRLITAGMNADQRDWTRYFCERAVWADNYPNWLQAITDLSGLARNT